MRRRGNAPALKDAKRGAPRGGIGAGLFSLWLSLGFENVDETKEKEKRT